MKRIVFLERNSFPPGVPRIRRPGFPHEWVEFDETHPDRAAERLQGRACRGDEQMPHRRLRVRGEEAPTLELRRGASRAP